MIDLITLKNFQGKTGSYSLGDVTVLSGRNGSGKSTIIKAIQLLLCKNVEGDSVKRQAGDQFRCYCSGSDGVMSIEIHCDGQAIKREWTKSNGKVSTIITLNGAKVKDKTDLLEMAGVRIFDVAKYWASTPSEQVEVLCRLADVDVDRLIGIQKDLSKVNTDKKDKMAKLKEARAAKKDFEVSMQSIVADGRTKEGFNLENAKGRIVALGRDIRVLNQQLVDSAKNEAKAKANDERMSYLKSQVKAIHDEAELIVIPLKDIDVTHLERERDEMDKIKLANLNLEKTQAKITRMENMPIVGKIDNDEEIESLRSQILKASSGQGVTERDKLGYEIGKEVFHSVSVLEMPEEYHEMAKKAVRDIVLVYKEKCEYAEDTTILQKIRSMEHDLRELVRDARDNDLAISEQNIRAQEIAELKLEVGELEAVGFDQELYNDLINDLSSRSKSKQEIEALVSKKDDLADQASNFANEMLELSQIPSREKINEKEVSESIELKDKELVSLTENHDTAKEWQTVSTFREKKVKEVEALEFEVSACRTKEEQLLIAKTDLLNDVEAVLTARCDKILHPERITLEIPEDGERVRFYLHGANGDAVESATICGGEKVRFDAALSYSLVGKNGLIAMEVAEIDRLTMDMAMPRMKEIRECQLIIAGHDLARFEEDNSITFYGMD